MPEPSDQKPNIFSTLSSPDAEKRAPGSAEPDADLTGLKQHADAPKLDGYLMLRSIGNGGYAQVWEAHPAPGGSKGVPQKGHPALEPFAT
jgi:hypothetical protein